VSLKGFPRRTLRGDRSVYRIHKSTRAPWWFSANGDGRFDPVRTGTGACYLAEAPLGAWVEVFRKRQLLAEAEVAERSLLAVTLGRDLRLADLTSRRALSFAVTASLGASEQYHESQTFAAQAIEAGFDGVRYLVRHEPAQKLYGLALFGQAGNTDPADPLWPADSQAIPDALVRDAQRLFGYRVLPTP
jgi:RES domain-containing protein